MVLSANTVYGFTKTDYKKRRKKRKFKNFDVQIKKRVCSLCDEKHYAVSLLGTNKPPALESADIF